MRRPSQAPKRPSAPKSRIISTKLGRAAQLQLEQEPLAADLFVTACGSFPRADWHSVQARTLDEHVLIHCQEGAGWLRLEERIMPVIAGDIFICPSGIEHGYGSSQAKPWSILWLHFSGNKSAEVLRLLEYGQHSAPFYVGQDEVIANSLRQVVALYARRDDMLAGLDASVALRQVIVRWMARKKPSPRIPREIQRVLATLREDPSKAHSVEALAGIAGWSPSYFARSFQRATGKSPINYLVHLRINHASRLLMTTREPVGLIAKRSGYEDAYYFSRLFRSVTGLSPRDYRRTLGEVSEAL